MREYEIMWILPGDSTEKQVDDSIVLVKNAVESRGGEIETASLWQKRTLSYPIKNFMEGTYCLAQFLVEREIVSELNGLFQAEQSILRHLIVSK